MRGLGLLLALGFVAQAHAATVSFDALVATPNLWALSQDEFQKAAATLPFEWTSSARDSARASVPGMTLFGMPLVEVVARFEGRKLSAFTANIYARGDVGELPKEKFDLLVRWSAEAIGRATKAKFTVRGRDPASAVKADGLVWKTDTALYTLEYSFTKETKSRGIPFRAEFVRLEIISPPKGAGSLLTASVGSRPLFIPASHLQRDVVTGDVFIKDVPMVDQGQKGYCVVASTERVMRYYGVNVDANELAQVANSDAEGGTGYTEMVAALKKVAAVLKVRVREVQKFEIRDILTMIKDYNRAAKKAGARELPDPGYRLDMNAIYGAMKGELLREARTKNKENLDRFQRSVRESVEKGVPLLWTVSLGLFPEKDVPQGGGGHMRIIIGYNPKTNDVLYTDSWGAGHELKRMSAVDAWTITTGLMTIEPL
jgi:hypothetical protein